MTKAVFSAVAAFALASCIPAQFDSQDESKVLGYDLQTRDFEANSPRETAYEDALETLFDLQSYGFDSSDFYACDAEDLVPLDRRRLATGSTKDRVDQLTTGLSGDEAFELMITVSELSIDDLAKQFEMPGVETIELRDSVLLELIVIASDRESPQALNEIGAAHLYCYLGVEQNIDEAVEAFKESANLGDPLAKMSLGKIFYQGLDGYLQPETGTALQDQAFEAYLQQLRTSRERSLQAQASE